MASTSVVFDILARDRASSKFDKLNKSLHGSTTKMAIFTGLMQGVGQAAARGFGNALYAVGRAGVAFAKAAVQDNEAMAVLEGQLKRNAGATDEQVEKTENWIDKQGVLLGVTDDELRPALGRLVTATKDVSEAQDLASLAMDVSAGSGKSLESVSTALMKAQNGNVGALARLGIQTKDATGKTLTMEQAVKQMSETFGGAATEKADTLSGKIGRLKLMFSEAGESLLKKLLPYIEQFANYLLETAVPHIKQFIDQMDKGRGAGGRFAEKIVDIKNKLQAASKFVLKHKEDLLKLSAGYLTVRTSVRLLTIAVGIMNGAMALTPWGLAIAGAIGLGAGFIYAYKHSEKFRSVTHKVARELFGLILQMGNFARDAQGSLTSAVLFVVARFNNMQSAIGFVTGAVGNLIGAVQNLIHWLGQIKVPNIHIPGMPPRGIFTGGSGAAPGEAFSSGASIFGTDLSVEEGAPPKTIQALLAAGAAAKASAQQLLGDVTSLIGKGLSKTLLSELKAQGESGAEQIHLLASGTAAEIAQANADAAEAAALLKAAGLAVDAQLAAGPFGPGGPRVPTVKELSAEEKLVKALDKWARNMTWVLKVDGKTFRAIVERDNRLAGRV
jgi:hypothetical protein